MSPRVVELRELICVHYGKALKQEERAIGGEWTVYGSSGAVGTHDDTLTTEPTIIIGRKGSVGAITYAPFGGWTIDTAFYTQTLNPSRLDLRYLYYALCQAGLDRHTITTSIPGINREDIYSTKIPVPPLSEQKHIAAILDKADAIRKKRKKAIELTETFLRSAFLEMFGDPVTNPKGWPCRSLGEITGDDFRNGLSPSSDGVHPGKVLTLSAVIQGTFDARAVKEAAFAVSLPTDKTVRKQDFLICRGNGNLSLCGTGRFPDQDMPDTAFPDTMIAARVNESIIAPRFLEVLWESRLN